MATTEFKKALKKYKERADIPGCEVIEIITGLTGTARYSLAWGLAAGKSFVTRYELARLRSIAPEFKDIDLPVMDDSTAKKHLKEGPRKALFRQDTAKVKKESKTHDTHDENVEIKEINATAMIRKVVEENKDLAPLVVGFKGLVRSAAILRQDQDVRASSLNLLTWFHENGFGLEDVIDILK